MSKPKMIVIGHAEAKILLDQIDRLDVPSLVAIRSGQGTAYMADAAELRAWRSTNTSDGEQR